MTVEDIEIKFISMYPKGFLDDEYLLEAKKYKDHLVVEMFNNEMSKSCLEVMLKNGEFDEIIDAYTWVIKRAWLPSRFDKRAFKNFVELEDVRIDLCFLMYEVMYGDIESNFDRLIDLLGRYKKDPECNFNASTWPIITTFLFYARDEYYPVKPTTVKKLSVAFNVDFKYQSRPNLISLNLYNDFCNKCLLESSLCTTKQQMDILLFIAIHY